MLNSYLNFNEEGYPPAIVKNEERDRYQKVLTEADQEDLRPFIECIANTLIETEAIMVDELGRKNAKKWC